MIGVKVQLNKAQWDGLAERFKNAGKHIGVYRQAAIMKECRRLAGEVRKYILAGNNLAPLSPNTALSRGGRVDKPLASFARDIQVKATKGGGVVALNRQTKSGVDLGKIHTEGRTIAIRMTDKMRRFLFGVLFKDQPKQNGNDGLGIVIVKIPPRPFIEPVYQREQSNIVRNITADIEARLSKLMSEGALWQCLRLSALRQMLREQAAAFGPPLLALTLRSGLTRSRSTARFRSARLRYRPQVLVR